MPKEARGVKPQTLCGSARSPDRHKYALVVAHLILLDALPPEDDDDTFEDRLLWAVGEADLRAIGILPPRPTLSLVPPASD